MSAIEICPVCRPEFSIGYTGEIKMGYCETHDKFIFGNAPELFEPLEPLEPLEPIQAIEKELK